MTPQKHGRIVRLFTWRGRLLHVVYNRNGLGCGSPAHLTLRTLDPPRGILPVTETGYRSRFLNAEDVAAIAGPVAFARVWLDKAALNRSWLEAEAVARQLSLF